MNENVNYDEKIKKLDEEIKALEEEFEKKNVQVDVVLAFEDKLKVEQAELASLKEEKEKLLAQYAKRNEEPKRKLENNEMVDLKKHHFGYLYPDDFKKLNKMLVHFDRNLFRIIISMIALIVTLAVLVATSIGGVLSAVIAALSAIAASVLVVEATSKTYLKLNVKSNKMYNNVDFYNLIKQRLDEVSKAILTKQDLCELYYASLMPKAIMLRDKRAEKEKLEHEKTIQDNSLFDNIEFLIRSSLIPDENSNFDLSEDKLDEKSFQKVLK